MQLGPGRAALRVGAMRVGWKIGLDIHDVEGQIDEVAAAMVNLGKVSVAVGT